MISCGTWVVSAVTDVAKARIRLARLQAEFDTFPHPFCRAYRKKYLFTWEGGRDDKHRVVTDEFDRIWGNRYSTIDKDGKCIDALPGNRAPDPYRGVAKITYHWYKGKDGLGVAHPDRTNLSEEIDSVTKTLDEARFALRGSISAFQSALAAEAAQATSFSQNAPASVILSWDVSLGVVKREFALAASKYQRADLGSAGHQGTIGDHQTVAHPEDVLEAAVASDIGFGRSQSPTNYAAMLKKLRTLQPSSLPMIASRIAVCHEVRMGALETALVHASTLPVETPLSICRADENSVESNIRASVSTLTIPDGLRVFGDHRW